MATTKTARSTRRSAAAPEASAGFALERSLTYRLHVLAKLTDRASHAAYLEATGLGHSEGRCLAAIGRYAPLSLNDFAASANLNKGQASRAVQSLCERGLARKTASPTDGRGVVLALTAAGERLYRRILAVVERRNREITACLDESERERLDGFVDRLIAAARAGAGADAGRADDSESEGG